VSAHEGEAVNTCLKKALQRIVWVVCWYSTGLVRVLSTCGADA